MARLTPVSGREALKRFRKAGWSLARIHGSHAVLVRRNSRTNLSVPLHEELGIGILRRLVHLSGLTVEEFGRL